jgi:homocysteine S-methyltransferase
MPTPLAAMLAARGTLVLDGGLATELERAGHDLSDRLWSARLLRDDPDAIRSVHLAYLRAGADVSIAASYQASFEGFAAAGIGEAEAGRLLRRAVDLAREAAGRHERERGRASLVAASVGPYGAMLADGSEYRGRYACGRDRLATFHRRRLQELIAAGPDLLAVETIPSLAEAEVLAEILAELPPVPAWISFTCRDGSAISDGSPIEVAVAAAARAPGVAAVGVNCTAPELVSELLERARSATDLPLVAYPNDGRMWDAAGRRFVGAAAAGFPASQLDRWHALGARLIGGCCGIGPRAVRALAGWRTAGGRAGAPA